MGYSRLLPGAKWAPKPTQTSDTGDGLTSRVSAVKIKQHLQTKIITHLANNGFGVDYLRYSNNGGLSFLTASLPAGMDGCYDVTESGNTLYGLFFNSGTNTASIASSRNGASWVNVYTHGSGKQAFNIAASGSSYVAFVARNNTGADIGHIGTHYELVIGDGVTFTTKTISPSYLSLSDKAPLIAFIGRRLVIYMSDGSTTSKIITSDDLGDTWTVRYTDSAHAEPIDLLESVHHGVLFALRGAHPSLLRSTNGTIWESINVPGDAVVTSIAYDVVRDVLYMFADSGDYYGLRNATQLDVSLANAALAATSDDEFALHGVPPYWLRLPSGPPTQTLRSLMVGGMKRP